MARETYRETTPETKLALEDHVKDISEAWGKSTTYIYDILKGLTADPFSKFKQMFRAVARKNPDGARGYLATLNRIFAEENPEKRAANERTLESDYLNFKSLLIAREEGYATPAEVEAARERLAETLARVGVPEKAEETMKV